MGRGCASGGGVATAPRPAKPLLASLRPLLAGVVACVVLVSIHSLKFIASRGSGPLISNNTKVLESLQIPPGQSGVIRNVGRNDGLPPGAIEVDKRESIGVVIITADDGAKEGKRAVHEVHSDKKENPSVSGQGSKEQGVAGGLRTSNKETAQEEGVNQSSGVDNSLKVEVAPSDIKKTKVPSAMDKLISQADDNRRKYFPSDLEDNQFDRQTGGSLIPLVTTITTKLPANKLCRKTSPIYKNLEFIRTRNELVHLIGPPSCSLLKNVGIKTELWSSYSHVLEAFREDVGWPKPLHARWYVLKEFMERHQYHQIFYFEPDIRIFANITEAVDLLLEPEERHVMLVQTWPDLADPAIVARKSSGLETWGQTSLWSYRGLLDFLAFHTYFLSMDILYGRSTTKFLVELQFYVDPVILGWYTYTDCWRCGKAAKVCKPETKSGFTPHRVARVCGKFNVRFNVTSAVKPRMCNMTSWSDPGWCVFGHGNPKKLMVFKEGTKCPTVKDYWGLPLWLGNNSPKKAVVQFLTARVDNEQLWF